MSGWGNIVGHDWAVTMLREGIAHERIGHAYLITGAPQLGKTLLAKTFAQTLICQSDSAEKPCGDCRNCTLALENRHPDILTVEPELSSRGKPTLKIDAVRELQKGLSLAPVEARYKIAILRNFDAATIGASNAFLKTLEEPPKNVILLLTAADADNMLPTIQSRCRVLALRPTATAVIDQALRERHAVPPDESWQVAHLANGRFGHALNLWKNSDQLTAYIDQRNLLTDVLNDGRIARFQLAEQLAKKPEAIQTILTTWLGWWRDVALLAHGGDAEKNVVNIDVVDAMQTHAQKWPPLDTVNSLKQTKEAISQIQQNGNIRLVLENLLLSYPLPRVPVR